MTTNIQKIEQKMATLINSRQKLFDLKKPIDEKIKNTTEEIQKVRTLISTEKLKSVMSFEEKFEFLFFEDGRSIDNVRNSAARNLIENELGLFMSGWCPFSQQKVIQIKLHKGTDSNLNKVFESFSKILPLIKPMDEEGNKNIGIFEHTLSYSESIYLQITPTNEFHLMGNRNRVKKSFPDLLTALTFIQQYHYYSSSLLEDQEISDQDD